VDPSVLKTPLELPRGFIFEDLEFGEDKRVSSGKAFIYFFPQGFVTRAAIHISDKKTKKFTISVHPLTGQGYAVQEYVSLKEIE
jgi:general secretion pathway protein H